MADSCSSLAAEIAALRREVANINNRDCVDTKENRALLENPARVGIMGMMEDLEKMVKPLQ